MEWISHTTTGFFLGQLMVAPDQRPKRAGWWWALASISPDWLEFITRWFGDIHRGVTHSLYAWPLLALAWAMAARRWGRVAGCEMASLGRLWAAFFVVVGSHLLLDVFMPYRIYLAWPFSEVKWAWDIMPLYDVYIFAGWLVLFYLHRRYKLASVTTAKIGLAIFLAVFAIRMAGKSRARAILTKLPDAGAQVALRTIPAYYQPWIWYVRLGKSGDNWAPLNVITGDLSRDQIRAPFFPPLPGREHLKLPDD